MSEANLLPAQRRHALEVFPVTILLALQYGALVAIPAVLHQTQPESTILSICGLGVFVAFVVEGILLPIGVAPKREIPATWRGARAVMVVGWIAAFAGAFVGQGRYSSQIGTTSISSLASVATPFAVWPLLGMAISLGLRRSGRISDRTAYVTIAINLVLQLALAIYDARLAPFTSFALVTAFLVVVTRMVRLRWILLAVLLIPLVWPPLFNFRNELRVQQGEVVNPYSTFNAGTRLRLDLEMAQISEFPKIPTNIGQPSLATLIEFGLIPRFLESGRGTINTGSGLSVALGSPADNSSTVTALGFAYLEQSWLGIILYVGCASLAVGVVIRRRGPWALAMLAVLLLNLIWIESTYPDMIAGVLQDVVSLGAALVFVEIFFGRDRHGAVPRQGSLLRVMRRDQLRRARVRSGLDTRS